MSMQQMVKLLRRGTAEEEQVSKHGGDKRNVTTQLLAIPNIQLQKFFGQWKDCWNNSVMTEGSTLKAIMTATPQVSQFVVPSLWLDTFFIRPCIYQLETIYKLWK
jgi:hypothetical protein